MKNRIFTLALVFCFLASAFPITAYSAEEPVTADDKTLSPYFFVENADASADSFPLKETNVKANINGVIADVYVTQTYANEGTKPVNVSYVFPASTKVSVHGMKMQIGDNTVTAQIKEREKARQDYEEAKSEGKSASLLEQERPNVFTMSVANILPGDVVSIELHYTELIVSTENIYEFVFPTVVAPRYSSQSADAAPQTDQWVASPYLPGSRSPSEKYNITVNLSSAVPISGLTSGSHDVQTNWNGTSAAKVTLSNPEEFAGDKDYILTYKLTGQEMQYGLMLQTGGSENFFMLTVQPPDRVQVDEKPPREYIFILDVSGSMNGFPLDTAKELIKDLLTHLRATDRFNLVLFSDTSIQMSHESMQATEKNINGAIDLIDKEFGGGGTEIGLALERAAAIPKDKEAATRSVIVITDGEIATEQAVIDFVSKNTDNTNYFSFGIGSAVNRYLVEGIARAGLGESFVATQPSEVPDIADRFRTYVESPVLTDLQVTYSGFDAYDIEPSSLPVLFAQRPIVLFGKWRGSLTNGSVRITGKIGDKDYNQVISLSDLKPLETNTAIGYLWARKTVEKLLDYGAYAYSPDIEQKVTEIGLKYSMMTPYTSFVAVLETVRNSDEESIDVVQPLPIPSGVSDLAVADNPSTGAESNVPWLYAFAAVLLLAGFCVFLIPTIAKRKKIGGH